MPGRLSNECCHEISRVHSSQRKTLIKDIPLSSYALTESEVILNVGDKDWYLKKILLFGTAIFQISKVDDLVPNIITNTLFGGLVLLVREFPEFNNAYILGNQLVQQLRHTVIENCGIAEYFLEAFYAEQIIGGHLTLRNFPYFENYELLMSFEAKCIQGYLGSSLFRNIRTIVFIGSGPLPLSSIQLISHLPKTAKVINYDHSAEAVTLGQAIVTSQNLSHRISFVKSSALEIEDLRNADIVYLAALAGGDSIEKRQITEHLYRIMKPFSLLVARSSTNLRTFIYHQLTANDFGKFQGFCHFNPTNKVIINSLAIGIKLEL